KAGETVDAQEGEEDDDDDDEGDEGGASAKGKGKAGGNATDYDYLLGMAIWGLTKEKIAKLKMQAEEKEKDFACEGAEIAVEHRLGSLPCRVGALPLPVPLTALSSVTLLAEKTHQLTSRFSTLAFFLTAHFSEEDYPYNWLMLWLSPRPEWQRSRKFEMTTRSSDIGADTASSFRDFEDANGTPVPTAVDDNEPGKVTARGVPAHL
ncbi:hypothetical protein DXG01_013479, partial [Tephrocybe rancida]